MDLKKIFDDVVNAGKSALQSSEHEDKTRNGTASFDPLLKTLLAGVGGGMLGGLLSGKGSNALGKLGGSAALATVAYKAYQNFTKNTATNAQPYDPMATEAASAESFTNDSSINPDIRAKAIVLAIINAAKADGEFDENERAMVSKEAEKMASNETMLAWMKSEISSPLNVNELVALVANNPKLATEIMTVSIVCCAEPNENEKNYLDQLRNALGIEPALKKSIEDELFS